jgi:hypothetical protein
VVREWRRAMSPSRVPRAACRAAALAHMAHGAEVVVGKYGVGVWVLLHDACNSRGHRGHLPCLPFPRPACARRSSHSFGIEKAQELDRRCGRRPRLLGLARLSACGRARAREHS